MTAEYDKSGGSERPRSTLRESCAWSFFLVAFAMVVASVLIVAAMVLLAPASGAVAPIG
jgi:hypothetical protein